MSQGTRPARYRWILYLSQNIPGSQSFDLQRVASLDAARDAFRKFCDAVGSDDCHAFGYWHDDDAWQSAQEFRNVGCPFDYPSFLVEHGPRGGVRLESC